MPGRPLESDAGAAPFERKEARRRMTADARRAPHALSHAALRAGRAGRMLAGSRAPGGFTMSAETIAAGPPARGLRIHLVSPRGPLYRHRTGIWKRSLRYAPLTLTTLASLVPDD